MQEAFPVSTMKPSQRTPAVKFDDIPGELPEGGVPEDVDIPYVEELALRQLNELKPDCLTNKAAWRVFLAFTDTFRTF
jgi:hypothetical protein